MAKKSPVKAKRACWKKRAIAAEYKWITLSEHAAQLGFMLEKSKSGERQALTSLMESERKLARAVTVIRCAAEIVAGTGTGATFRMIADDLCPRDTCADEQV